MSLSSLITKFIDLFYLKPLRKVFPQQVFRYLACGAATAALDAVWYYIASLAVVFPITFFTGFWLNRNVAFRSVDVRTLPQMLRYALTVVGSIALNYICMKVLVEYFGVWATPSKMITTLICAVYSYLAGCYYTFTSKRKSKN